MKKLWLVLLLFALLLAACAPAIRAVAPLMQLPDEARQLILFLVTAGLTWLLLQLSVWLKWDLSGYAQPLAAVISPIIITILEHYLQMIPQTYDSMVLTLIHLIVLLLGSVGTFLLFKKVKAKQAKSLLA